WDIIVGALAVFLNVGIIGAAGKAFTALRTLFTSAWKAIGKIFTDAFALIRGYVTLFMTGIRGYFDDGIRAIKKFFVDGFAAIRGYFTLFFTGARKAVSDGMSAIRKFFSETWTKVQTTARAKLAALVKSIDEWIGKAVKTVKELPGRAQRALGSL